MAGTLVRRVLLQIKADDGDTEAKLDAISLKADELAEKHPELKVRIDTAAASAKVAVLRAELKGLSAQADEEAAKGGILSRLLGGGKSFGGGLAGVLKIIPGLGGLAGLGGSGAGEAGQAAGSVGGSGPAGAAGVGAGISLLVTALPAIATELTGLVSGFAAAGAGAGAFGLLALPAFKKVSGAVQQVQADQQAYDRALTATARNSALKHLQEDYAKLDPAQRSAVGGIQSLSGEFGKLGKAFEPQAFKIFSDVLGIANQLLPDVVPFANSFANALHGLLGSVSKFAGSKGFKDWLAQFQKLSGPSVTAIGTGVGHLVTSFGKLLTVMSAKDVVNALNIAFSVLDGTIIALTGFVRGAMMTWDALTTAWDLGTRIIRRGGHDVAAVFDAVRHAAAELGHDIAVWFGRIRHDIAQWAGDVKSDTGRVVSWFAGLPGRILSAVGNLGSLLFNAGKNVIQGLINGVKSMIGDVGGAMGSVLGEIRNFLPFSPAKKGPLSGAGSPDIAGRKVGLMFADGMRQSVPAVTVSAAQLTRGAMPGAGAHPAGGATGGAQRIQLEVVGNSNDMLVTLLKKNIRLRGGDPSVLGA